MAAVEKMKAEQNATSKENSTDQKVRRGTFRVMAQMKTFETIKVEGSVFRPWRKSRERWYSLPNLPDEDVCAGGRKKIASFISLAKSRNLILHRKIMGPM